jgi:hypothetical protein
MNKLVSLVVGIAVVCAGLAGASGKSNPELTPAFDMLAFHAPSGAPTLPQG